MPPRDALCLHEEITLLALHAVKGRVPQDGYYIYAAGAALVSELLLQKRIAIEDRRWPARALLARAQTIYGSLLEVAP